MTSRQARYVPAAIKPVDPDVLRLVRASASRLAPFADDFARHLHADIVSLIPNVADAMAGQGQPFCQRMARAALWVALTDQSPGEIAAELRLVGAANRQEGFAEADYVSVAHALVRAVRSLTETEWITSMGSAWISCFLWMQPHLVAGASQPEPRPVARHAAPAGGLADDDDDDETGYGQLMVAMTLNSRRDRPQH